MNKKTLISDYGISLLEIIREHPKIGIEDLQTFSETTGLALYNELKYLYEHQMIEVYPPYLFRNSSSISDLFLLSASITPLGTAHLDNLVQERRTHEEQIAELRAIAQSAEGQANAANSIATTAQRQAEDAQEDSRVARRHSFWSNVFSACSALFSLGALIVSIIALCLSCSG